MTRTLKVLPTKYTQRRPHLRDVRWLQGLEQACNGLVGGVPAIGESEQGESSHIALSASGMLQQDKIGKAALTDRS